MKTTLMLVTVLLFGSCASPASHFKSSEQHVRNVDTDERETFLVLSDSTSVLDLGNVVHYGLADDDGEIILDVIYGKVRLLNNQIAFTSLDHKGLIFDLQKREFKEARFDDLGFSDNKFMGWNYPYESDLEELTLLDQETGDVICVIERLDGVTQLGDLMILHKTLDDGTEISQVVDGAGRQVSPVIPRVIGKYWSPEDMDLVFQVGEVEANEADLPDRSLYIPLGLSGTPLTLPPDCIGMVSLGTDLPDSNQKFGMNNIPWGWAIVYEMPTGAEFSIATNSLSAAEVLARAEVLPRYTQLSMWESVDFWFSKQNYLLAKDGQGNWQQFILNDLEPFLEDDEIDYQYRSITRLKNDYPNVLARRDQANRDREAAQLAAELKAKQERRKARLHEFEGYLAQGQMGSAWSMTRNDDELFVLCMHRVGSSTLADMIRYNKVTETHLYADEIEKIWNQVAAQQQAEYERQVKITRQIQAAADREAYKHRNDWNFGASNDPSMFEATMQHSKQWTRQNAARWHAGANVIYYPK